MQARESADGENRGGVGVDIFRPGNGSKSNLVPAKNDNKITSAARVKIKNSVAETGNKTNAAKTKKETTVVNPTAFKSGWRAPLRVGKVSHKK
jgi:hypothetical protein